MTKAKRTYRHFNAPPTLVCEYCGKGFAPLLRLYGGKNHGFYYEQRFCDGVCRNRARDKKVKVDKHGYVYTYRPGSTKTKRTQVYAHRVVMEQKLGRLLEAHETVHHINGDRSDNRPENLELWASRHGRGQRVSDLPFRPLDSVHNACLSFGA